MRWTGEEFLAVATPAPRRLAGRPAGGADPDRRLVGGAAARPGDRGGRVPRRTGSSCTSRATASRTGTRTSGSRTTARTAVRRSPSSTWTRRPRRRTRPCGGSCSASTWSAPSAGTTPRSTSRCGCWSPTRGRSRPRPTMARTPGSSMCRPRSSARRYAAEVDLVLGVTDALLPQNDGAFRLRGGPEGAEVTATQDSPDLRLGIRELGASLPRRGLTGHAAAGRPGHRGDAGRAHPDGRGLRLGPAAVLQRLLLVGARRA